MKALHFPDNYYSETETAYLRNLKNLTDLKTLSILFKSYQALENLICNPNIELRELRFGVKDQSNNNNHDNDDLIKNDVIEQFTQKICSANLKKLTIVRTNLNETQLTTIVNSELRNTLEYLGLCSCWNLDDKSFKIIIKANFSKIEHLYFHHNDLLTDNAVESLIQYLMDESCHYKDTLKYVDFIHCRGISENAIIRIKTYLSSHRDNERKENS